MSDVPTATKIAALEDHVLRLLAENVLLSNEAAFMRGFINNEDVRSDFQTVTQMRQALDRERERCGVLEREVKEWRRFSNFAEDSTWREAWDDCGDDVCKAEEETDTRHALDAAKFVGGGQ